MPCLEFILGAISIKYSLRGTYFIDQAQNRVLLRWPYLVGGDLTGQVSARSVRSGLWVARG